MLAKKWEWTLKIIASDKNFPVKDIILEMQMVNQLMDHLMGYIAMIIGLIQILAVDQKMVPVTLDSLQVNFLTVFY